jgi:hypothetical protein
MSDQRNEASIVLALQALHRDPKLSVRRAAHIYNIPRTSLRDRKNGIQPRRDIMTNSLKQSDLEEQKLVEYILDLDSRGFSPRSYQGTYVDQFVVSLFRYNNLAKLTSLCLTS